MKTIKINISELKENQEFKNFYTPQSNEDLVTSYQNDGQRVPITISDSNEIVNGYRMIDAIIKSGGTKVLANVMKGIPTIHDRVLLNLGRDKTTQDQISEIKEVFNRFPKQQGFKKVNGKRYKRDEFISACLNNRWNGDKSIKKLEDVKNNDLEGNPFLTGILEKNWSLNSCYEYITKNKKIDETENYGFTKQIIKGEITPVEANSFVEKKVWLDNDYQHSFKILEKAYSYHIDCVELPNLGEHLNTVDALVTSGPYYQLRGYQSELKVQLGHEKTKEEFCDNFAAIIGKLIPLLKNSANVFFNIGETYDDGVGLGIPQLLKSTIESKTSLIYKDTLYWQKKNPKPQNETIKRTVNNLEHILWFVVDPLKAKFNLITYPVVGKTTKINRGCKDVDANGIIWGKAKSLTNPYGKINTLMKEQEIQEIILTSAGKNNDVYEITKGGESAPAVMSPLLPVIPILMTTDEGDVVFDPFSGSNVVGRASCLLNRVALSTEISKEYYNIGCKMLEKAVDDFHRPSLDIINEIVNAGQIKPGIDLSTAA